ncbi:MAG: FlgD immunoglobulin-like domain containing protein [Candidatus Eisenbacteria bacterium]
MISGRNRWIWTLSLLLALPGCEKSSNPYNIPPIVAGVVRLDASLSDASGNSIGTQVHTTTDGVGVWLMEGGRQVDSTSTLSGAYAFTMVRNHSYRTVFGVPPTFLDSSEVITPTRDVVFYADTLRLGRLGDFAGRPNPFSDAVSVRFSLAAVTHVDLDVYDLAARRVRVLGSITLPAGTHAVLWDGKNDSAIEVPDGMYWLLLQTPDETRAELVVKQP